MDTMLYKIGDVAKILGVSTDTIRHYEKLGLVKPVMRTENDYRYFDYHDVNQLMTLKWLRGFDFPLETISEMLDVADYHELHQFFLSREAQLEEEIARAQRLLERSREHRDALSRIEQHLNRIDIAIRPAYFWFTNRNFQSFDRTPESQSLSRELSAMMPFTHRYFDISLEELRIPGNSRFQWGMSCDARYWEEMHAAMPQEEGVHYVGPTRCLHTIIKANDNGFTTDDLAPMLRYGTRRGLPLVSPATGVLLTDVKGETRFDGYFEIWIPIQEAEHESD